MRSTIIILATAAAVSANACEKAEYKSAPACATRQSETYKVKVPVYQTYNCDAAKAECHAPDGYGQAYGDGKGYTYHRKYAYPGPKTRFCLKVKKIKKGVADTIHKITDGIKNIAHHIAHKIKSGWKHFKKHFEEWCAIARSDWERFNDWKMCEAAKWKAFWEYYHDLCRTRKALWDDAMREFHRHWHHYKKSRTAEYKAKKQMCEVNDNDYDDEEEYKQADTGNYLGYTPYEVKNYGVSYKEEKYNKYTQKENEVYSKEYNGYQDRPYDEYAAKFPEDAAKFD
jgi:hypothetical protein